MIGDSDMGVFFNTDEFASWAVFKTEPQRSVRGVFDNAFFDESIGQNILDTTAPRFTCALSDVAGIERGTDVEIDGKTYSVLAVEPEGTGLASVRLAHE